MYYYKVWVRSNRYHGIDPLTYSSQKKLNSGTIVEVELQNQLVSGFIQRLTTKPKFNTKEISKYVDKYYLPPEILMLSKWLKQYYPSSLGLITQQFIPAKFTTKLVENYEIKKFEPIKSNNIVKLNNDQKNAVKKMQNVNNYILHGITGSGKTNVYIEMAYLTYLKDKSSIILTPEISLITQLKTNFRKVFSSRVILFHSHQTSKEKLNSWIQVLTAKEPVIVIGPRSALFCPIKNVGLIVIDEEHEPAYKQMQSPQYLTSRVAAKYATITSSKLILGSATPLISDYYLAKAKNRPIIKLNKLALASKYSKPNIIFVDKKDKSLFSKSLNLSQILIEEINESLTSNKQVLLYLNRRGTSRMIMCINCGWQALCPHCSVPLIYHRDSFNLKCHSCDYTEKPPSVCPICSYVDIIYKSNGTKAIEDDVKKLFPNAIVSRFDTDNKKSESFNENFQNIINGEIDILIGTQLLAKGIDLPKLNLVGIILADTSLFLPDYTAQERTFQLINQVLGRIGRGHGESKAIIQTYNPDSSVLKYALKADYSAFYNSEINNRQKYFFPPYSFLLQLFIKRATLNTTIRIADQVKEKIIDLKLKVLVEGPAPAFHEKINNKYQWQLVVKSKDRQNLLDIVKILPANISYNLDPIDLM